MFVLLLRCLRRRPVSLLLTVLGLAVAFATTLSTLGLYSVLREGHPRGTDFPGDPVSIFMHASAMNFDFFLGPAQITAFQRDLGDSGQVLGAAGSRLVTIEIAGSPREAAVDVVSPNFFKALGVSFTEGDAAGWADPGAPPTCVVSERFLASIGSGARPHSIHVAGRQLRVAGVAREFSGLWDHETDIWVDWRLGYDLLFPTLRDTGIESQPWFYWTLAIPSAGEQAAFNAKLQRALSRRELTQPPFDGFRSLPGITNQVDLRRTAGSSASLYLVLCLIMLIVAATNLAAWSALTRAGRINGEWTLLRLGISRTTHALFGLGFVALPVLFGAFLALPLERLFSALLRRDPAIAALLAWSPEYANRYPWAAWSATVLTVATFGWVLGMIVARVSGLRFGASTLRSAAGAVERLFRPMAVLVSALAAVALLFGILECASALRAWRTFSLDDAQTVWLVGVRGDNGNTGRVPLDRTLREGVMRGVHARFPQTQESGFIKIRPLSAAPHTLSGFSLEPGGEPILSVLLNEVDSGALPALGVTLRSGRHLDPNPNSHELVVDSKAAAELARVARLDTVLGLQLHDSVGMPWRVVGVVDPVAYGSDLSTAPPVAYQTINGVPPVLSLVLRGPYTSNQVEQFAKGVVRLDGGEVRFEAPVNLAHAADRAQAQFRSRALLSVIAAIITISISSLTILSLVTLVVRRRRRTLAIRLSLGEAPWKTAFRGAQGVLLSTLAGCALGCLALWLAQSWMNLHRAGQTEHIQWAVVLCCAILVALSGIGAAAVLAREFFAPPLSQHLRED
jgi:hypothetical protein